MKAQVLYDFLQQNPAYKDADLQIFTDDEELVNTFETRLQRFGESRSTQLKITFLSVNPLQTNRT